MAKINLSALRQSLASGLNQLWVKAVPGDNVYVAGGVQLDLTPSKILDPSGIGVTGPNSVPSITPGVFAQNMGGYTASVVPATGKSTAGLSTYKLMFFAPGGAEIGAGAYNAAITAGSLVLQIVY